MRIGPLRWWSSGSTHVAWGIEASIAPDDDWAHQRTQDYGASFAALRALAAQKGYRLIHVHGPRSLYFLRDDLAFPDELCIAPGFGAEELRWLTDATAFYSTFSSGGSLPGWFDAPAPDVSRAPWQLLAQPGKTAKVDIDGLSVEVLADKQDLAWYQQRKVFEESASLMYRFVRDEGFVNFVDVGANVGFISMLARRAAPALNIISIEADPRLARLIEANFSANGLERPTVVNAVVGEHARPSSGFSLNPKSTLDNRVAMSAWQQVQLPMVKLDELLATQRLAGRTFFKIDTQGFEPPILRGLEGFLARNDDWVLKMEFAPNWLLSQGNDPLALLEHLQARYQFAEYAERIPYGTSGFEALFQAPVLAHQHADFLAYVVSLNKGRLGWVDLIVRPRPAP